MGWGERGDELSGGVLWGGQARDKATKGRAGLGKLLRQRDDPQRVLASEDCLITSGKDTAQQCCRIPPTGVHQVKLHT